MIFPTPKLLRYLVWGSPLWLFGLIWPGLGTGALVWIAGMLILACTDITSRPKASDLSIRRELDGKLAYKDQSTVKLYINNHSPNDYKITLRDEVPLALGAPIQLFELSIEAGQTKAITYSVTPTQRGHYEFKQVSARIRWGKMLLQKDLAYPINETVPVYPHFRGYSDYDLMARIAEREEALRPRRTRGLGSDYESLQLYMPGQDIRLIDWKASARRRTLISRKPQVERGQHLCLMIDSGRIMAGEVQGDSRLEFALEAAVRLSYVVQTRGDSLSLAVFSHKIEQFIPKLKKQKIMATTLEALSDIKQSYNESDYWRVTAGMLANLRQRSLIILFTHILDSSASKGLLRNLRRAASRHVVLCVIQTDPALEAASKAKPSNIKQAWEIAAACDLLRRQRIAIEQMKASGILVLECAPHALNHRLIRKYLEIRRENLQ